MDKNDLEALFDRIRALPPEKLEDVADFLMWLEARDRGAYVLSDEERADIEEGLAEIDRGEFATDEEVAAVFARFEK